MALFSSHSGLTASISRMLRAAQFELYEQVRHRYQLPVLPIALYLRVGLEGVGWDVYEEHFWEHRLVHFTFPYVGLPALDAEQYLRGESILGVALAVMMRVPKERRASLAVEVLQRLSECGENQYRRFLLAECAQAYSGLDEQQRAEFMSLLTREEHQGARAMTTTFYEQGIEKGERRALRLLLEKKFGVLSPLALQRLEQLTAERVVELLGMILSASSLQELGLTD